MSPNSDTFLLDGSEQPMPAMRVCPTTRCPNTTAGGRCNDCKTKAEAKRGTATQRGYNSAGHKRFRTAVLTRDPICVCPDAGHGHQPEQCKAPSTVADHYPLSRRELVIQRLNPNDPKRGRGLCKPCHDAETAQHQPGGWNAR